MKITLRFLIALLISCATFVASAQSTLPFNHPKDQIALQLGAIQMGYTVPFQLMSGNATKAQQAANALVMGRNALDATVAKPAAKVQGFVSSPAVDTVEYRDQLYQAVEAVVTSPVTGSIRGSVSVVGSSRKVSVSAALTLPPNAYTIPVPYALEAATSVDAQILYDKMVLLGLVPRLGEVWVGTLPGTGGAAHSIATDSSGNLYYSDYANHQIRKITSAGVETIIAGSGSPGFADGNGSSASFSDPKGIAVDKSGNIYVADSSNHLIRKITPNGTVTTLAGGGGDSGGYGYADGVGTSAIFFTPSGVAVDGIGNIYVADSSNHLIRKITPNGTVTTLAGGNPFGYADGQGSAAGFSSPSGVAVDGSGKLYVADTRNHRIRKITPNGIVTTLAGGGGTIYQGPNNSTGSGSWDGQGTEASFNNPSGVAVDESGNVYVADTDNHLIRKITPSGIVTTLAGGGVGGYVNGQANSALFYNPSAVAVDGRGNVFVAHGQIRKITVSE